MRLLQSLRHEGVHPVRLDHRHLPELQLLLDGSLNACACDGCGELVTADVPIWINMEPHGLEPLFCMPLDYLENGYLDPTVLSDPATTNQIFYSRTRPPSPRANPDPPSADQSVMGEGSL